MVVCHLYNTTQRILVNGQGYENLIKIFLKPFFEAKLAQHIKNIDDFKKGLLCPERGRL